MHTLERVLRAAACSLALLTAATMRAGAQSSTSPSATLSAAPEADQPPEVIGKGYFQLAMAGGDQRSIRVVVKNLGADPMTIRAYPVDGVSMNGGGVSFNTFEQPTVAAGTWVTLDSPTMDLAPGESRRLTATVKVAANAASGDHVAGIAVEEARARPTDTSSQVVINVFYRRAIAVVVAVPGERTTALGVDGVALSQDERGGSHAVVHVRNTGSSLFKAKGTLDIGGSGPTSGSPQTFSVDTLIPGTGTGIAVPLPSLRLVPGTYNAHVVMQTQDGLALADWQGSAAFQVPGQAEPTAVPADVSLAPINALPAGPAALSDQDAAAIARQAGATGSAGFWLLGILAMLLVASGLGRFARRRR